MAEDYISLVKADYSDSSHGAAIASLLDHYAQDPMGGGAPLAAYTRANIATELGKLPHAISFIAFVNDKPAGLANCFMGFSTFACKPLINIHDIVVHSDFRGMQLSQKLLEQIESHARETGCCKITLEVLENNKLAQAAYRKFGFAGYALDPETGNALFWQKNLD